MNLNKKHNMVTWQLKASNWGWLKKKNCTVRNITDQNMINSIDVTQKNLFFGLCKK